MRGSNQNNVFVFFLLFISVFNRASESDESDLEDENEYMTPDEEMLKRKISGNEAPKLPPRNSTIHFFYVIDC